MIKDKIKHYFTKFSYEAVQYAERVIGSGFGNTKKQVAIDYILNKLPKGIKPFIPIIRPFIEKILDEVIEKAVDMLHEVQKRQKERLEKQENG